MGFACKVLMDAADDLNLVCT